MYYTRNIMQTEQVAFMSLKDIYIYIKGYIYIYIHIYVRIIFLKRGHKFEREQRDTHGRVWREKEVGNVIIIKRKNWG